MGSSSERTRTAITAALRKKLKDLMGEFQDLRQRLQDEYRRALLRNGLGSGSGQATAGRVQAGTRRRAVHRPSGLAGACFL